MYLMHARRGVFLWIIALNDILFLLHYVAYLTVSLLKLTPAVYSWPPARKWLIGRHRLIAARCQSLCLQVSVKCEISLSYPSCGKGWDSWNSSVPLMPSRQFIYIYFFFEDLSALFKHLKGNLKIFTLNACGLIAERCNCWIRTKKFQITNQ